MEGKNSTVQLNKGRNGSSKFHEQNDSFSVLMCLCLYIELGELKRERGGGLTRVVRWCAEGRGSTTVGLKVERVGLEKR